MEDRRLLSVTSPTQVANINNYSNLGSAPFEFTDVNGTTYFSASLTYTGPDGHGYDLWKDTSPGAALVARPNPTFGTNSGVDELTYVDSLGLLFFKADDGTNGFELWKYDPGTNTSSMVRDISGVDSLTPAFQNPSFTVFDDKLFFVANDGTNGWELWKSDGTSGNTQMVINLSDPPNPFASPDIENLTVVGDKLFFTHSEGGELWVTDGTTSTLLETFDSGGLATNLTNVNGTLYFSGREFEALLNKGVELWTSNGTPLGTVMVTDINTHDEGGLGHTDGSLPQELTNFNGTLFFTADDGVNGRELWKTDGTTAGTEMVRDINDGPGTGVANIEGMVNVNGRLFFTGDDGMHDGGELWQSDGDANSTVRVSQVTDRLAASKLTNINGTLYFRGDYIDPVPPNNDEEPWKIIGPATIVDRHLFYNQSGTASPVRYDGNNAAINSNDDLAIATDKEALLPGQTATFANVSSYSKGINGIMIDIAGSSEALSATDFIFRVGNNNSPSTWSTAPAPSSISVRAGAGVSGSDRVTITWANNDIDKQWLEVIVLANANTNLAENPNLDDDQADAFFFGNALGDSGLGDSSTQATVNTTDELGAHNNPENVLSNIPVTNIYDYNRDGAVNTSDELVVRNNPTTIGNVTKFLTLSSPPAAPEFASTSAQSDDGVAGALTASAIKQTLPSAGVPRWLVNRHESVDLNSGPTAQFFRHLAERDTPQARKALVAADQIADSLGLDDSLLDTLLDELGL